MSHRIWEIQYAGSPKTLWSGVKPTPEQLATADHLGIQVSPDDTFTTVASAILETVGNAIGCPPRVVSDRQRELADELEIDVTDCVSSWSAFVRIQEAIQLLNLDAVRRMGLKPGDRVVKADDLLERRMKETLGEGWESIVEQFSREFEISSIREDGQVYFKGGSGQAPARYLEKRTTPEATEWPDVRGHQTGIEVEADAIATARTVEARSLRPPRPQTERMYLVRVRRE